MPELPEVETIRRGLERRFLNLQLKAITILDERLPQNCTPADLQELTGKRLTGLTRRGKFLILHFGDRALIIHLRMSGRLLPSVENSKHVRLVLRFGAGRTAQDGEKQLVLEDPRRFATVHCAGGNWPPLQELEPLRRLGIEPFTPRYTFTDFMGILNTKQEIKRLLLDQRRIAGLGNIYANEALFRAQIHPSRPANSLSLEEARRLFAVIPQLLKEAIAAQGTTISDYRTASGESGRFQDLLLVYGRAGQLCPVCGTPIVKIKQGGRSTYFCPQCQR